VEGNQDCQKCDLYRSAQSVCLMGKGPIPSKVMIVGEAPGIREDEIEKPFAGKAGSVLTEALLKAGLNRKECYMTNACKCRPPDNRTPKTGEVKACKEYLEQEIREVKPKFVLLLGATALKAVLNKAKITEIHGQVFKENNTYYMATFHPAAAIRDVNKLDPLQADITRFVNLVKTGKEEKEPEIKYEVVKNFDTFNRCINYLRKRNKVAFDIETSQLSRKQGPLSVINCIGIGWTNKQWIIPLESEDSPWKGNHKVQKEMMSLISEAIEGKVVVAHNGKFDNLWLREKYRVRFPLSHDTMLMSHLLDENTPNGLKYLSRTKLGAPDYDISKKEKQGSGSLSKLYKYNAFDIHYTARVFKKLYSELKQDSALKKVFKYISMPMSHVYEDAEYEGIYIDIEQMNNVEKDLRKKIKSLLKKLKGYTEGKEVNWNSPQQVAKVLFQDWGLDPLEKTASGAPSTAESILLRLRKEHPGVETLLEYRGYQKLLSSFIDGWKKRMDERRIFPSYKIHGTVTGRPSCTDPNLQQVPRDSSIRSLITAPPGWVFVEADHSQVELRVTAMVSGDRTMKFIFQTKGDIHISTAQTVVGKEEISKDERKKAKAVNFGFIYGMGAPKFQEYARDKYDIIMTLSECKAVRARYFEKYYDLPKWHEKQRRIARMYKQVRTYTGRIRHLPEIDSPDQGKRAEAERQSINSPVQGFGAEITLMGAIDIHENIPQTKVKVVGTVHDSILMYIREDQLYKMLPKIKKMMENPTGFRRFGINLPVPLEAEFTVGPWGKGEEVLIN